MRTYNPNRKTVFQLPDDKETPATTWYLGLFPQALRSYLYEKHLSKIQPVDDKTPGRRITLPELMALNTDAVRYGLKAVENFIDDAQSTEKATRYIPPIVLEKVTPSPEIGEVEAIPEAFLSLLSPSDITIIGGKIWTLNFPQRDEKKTF